MRRAEPAGGGGAFQAPVDVHASADGHVFLFRRRLDGSADEDEDDLPAAKERPHPGPRRHPGAPWLEREAEGDGLSGAALQHDCTVADIKRVNNLTQEQDFYVLKSVRMFSGETSTGRSDRRDLLPSAAGPRPPDASGAHRQGKEVSEFVMDVDDDMERLIQDLSDPDEDVSAKRARFGGRAGALSRPEGGVQWWNAVVAMLLIGIILPVFFVLFYKMKNSGAASSADLRIQPSGSFPNASALTTAAAARRD